VPTAKVIGEVGSESGDRRGGASSEDLQLSPKRRHH